jgi:uncharacterized membrane protein YbhN (UPF0104 family)
MVRPLPRGARAVTACETRVRKPLKALLASALVAAFFTYAWTVRHEFVEAFSNLSTWSLASLCGLLSAHWILRAWRDRFLYSAAGHDPRVTTIFWLNTLQLSLNYLPLKAGTFSSAEVFRSKLGVPYREFALVFGQQYLLIVAASSLLAAAALALVPGVSVPARAGLALVLAGIGAGCFGLLWWDGMVRWLPAAISRRVEGGARKFAVFHSSPRKATYALVLTFAMCIVAGLRLVVVYGVLSLELGFPEALVISASMQLSVLVSITPAGIGITEAIVGLSSVLVGHTARGGVMAATIDRAVTLAFSIGLALLLAPFAWRRQKARAVVTLSLPDNTGGS